MSRPAADHSTIHQQVRALYGAAAQASRSREPHALAAALYGQDELTCPGALAASLGCANPTALVELQPGSTVLDLGSGGGLDALVCARRVGPSGRVVGVDMTPEMIELATQHAADADLTNVEFRLGTIEDLPIEDASVDLVISNCAISLSPAKDRVASEAWRVLTPGGQLAITDLATLRPLPASLHEALATRLGLIAGTLTVEDYPDVLHRAGFSDASIQVLHAFGLEDVALLEGTSLGGGILEGVPESDLHAADGALAAVHVTATKPAAAN
jgi:SAM-dependent methyltransferase